LYFKKAKMKKISTITVQNIDKSSRYTCLHKMAERQLARLNAIDAEKEFRKLEAKSILPKRKRIIN